MQDQNPNTLWRPESTLFALIIGIDEYADSTIPDLQGAVNDANDVQGFLTSFLHVPITRIKSLYNKEATRAAIEAEIKKLATNVDIFEEDPILIFFAGHGAQAKAPSGWPGGTETLQMLVPHDFVKSGSEDVRRGQGVLDVRLSHLLADLALKKSDNITVILDCCHSGSGTRKYGPQPEFTARGLDLPESYTIPNDLLDQNSAPRLGVVAKGSEKSGLRSHILLAACMRDQQARESQRRGVFTSNLIALLKKEGVDNLTYQQAITMLPEMSFQNPQCEGFHSERLLFNANIFSQRSGLYPIRATSKPGQYEVDAGEAHGVLADAEFTVYSTRDMSFCLGTVIASKRSPSKTVCKIAPGTQPFEFSKPLGYALHQRFPSIRILIDEGLETMVKEMKLEEMGVHFVKSHEGKSHLAIYLQDGCVHFKVMNQLYREDGLEHMPFTVSNDPMIIKHILQGVAKFYWHLDHDSSFKAFKDKITIECVQLEGTGEYTDLLQEVLVPVLDGSNLNRDDGVFISMDGTEDTNYGFEVTNQTDVPLYASVFYFDMSDLSIVPYYQPAAARNGQAEISLPGQHTLTVGYGSTGTTPISFYLREGQDTDIGFFKIYLSTEYINFSHIIQKSPFDTVTVPGDNRGMKQKQQPSIWGTKTVRIIQKKEHTSTTQT